MSRKHISQAEAHGFKRQVEFYREREAQRANACTSDYPGGMHLGALDKEASERMYREVRTARKLGCYVVVTTDGYGMLSFYAVKP